MKKIFFSIFIFKSLMATSLIDCDNYGWACRDKAWHWATSISLNKGDDVNQEYWFDGKKILGTSYFKSNLEFGVNTCAYLFNDGSCRHTIQIGTPPGNPYKQNGKDYYNIANPDSIQIDKIYAKDYKNNFIEIKRYEAEILKDNFASFVNYPYWYSYTWDSSKANQDDSKIKVRFKPENCTEDMIYQMSLKEPSIKGNTRILPAQKIFDYKQVKNNTWHIYVKGNPNGRECIAKPIKVDFFTLYQGDTTKLSNNLSLNNSKLANGIVTRLEGDDIALYVKLKNKNYDKFQYFLIDVGGNDVEVYSKEGIKQFENQEVKNSVEKLRPTAKVYSKEDVIIKFKNVKSSDKKKINFDFYLISKIGDKFEEQAVEHDSLTVRNTKFNLPSDMQIKLYENNQTDLLFLNNKITDSISMLKDGKLNIKYTAFLVNYLGNSYQFIDKQNLNLDSNTSKINSNFMFYVKPLKLEYVFKDDTMNNYFKNKGKNTTNYCRTNDEFTINEANKLDNSGKINCSIPGIINVNISDEPIEKVEYNIDELGRTNYLFANNDNFYLRIDISNQLNKIFNGMYYPIAYEANNDYSAQILYEISNDKKNHMQLDNIKILPSKEARENLVFISKSERNKDYARLLDLICSDSYCIKNGVENNKVNNFATLLNKLEDKEIDYIVGVYEPVKKTKIKLPKYTANTYNNKKIYKVNYFNNGEKINETTLGFAAKIHNDTKTVEHQVKIIDTVLYFKDLKTMSNFINIGKEQSILRYFNKLGNLSEVEIKNSCPKNDNYPCYNYSILGYPGFEHDKKQKPILYSQYNNTIDDSDSNIYKIINNSSNTTYIKDVINCLGRLFNCNSFTIEFKKQ